MCGVIRQTRDKWADEGLLRRRDEYDQYDLIELVILSLLLQTLRKRDAKLAWRSVRPQLRDVIAGPHLMLVWDVQQRSAGLALTPEDVVALVSHGRPVQVLDVGRLVEEAREAFRREADRRVLPDGGRDATPLTRSAERG
jgi:hypothetical protein